MKDFGQHYVRGLGMSAHDNALANGAYLAIAALEMAVSRRVHITVADTPPEDRWRWCR